MKHGGKAFKQVRPIYRALFCATLGDFFLDFHQYKGNEGPWFIVGMLSFLLMQIIYIVNFKKLPGYKGVPTNSKIFYVIISIVLDYIILPKLPKDMLYPLWFYSAFLAIMACITSGVSLKMGLGGFIFLASDTMIGTTIANMNIPYTKEIVIVTYLIAQFLIITEWSRKIRNADKVHKK